MLRFICLFFFATVSLTAQQTGDHTYVPPVGETAFEEGGGPVVVIDEAHHNFHTMEGRYRTFAEFLRRHNCTVLPGTQPLSLPVLSGADIYVIANALGEDDVEEWALPVENAFTTEEVDALARWVRQGGSLFLIADHMPFPGAVDSLALRFGIHFSNGFAFYEGKPGRGMMFTRENKTLRPHWITDTKLDGMWVDSVVTFTGSAFRIDGEHVPLLSFGARMFSVEPDTAWVFEDKTPRVNIEAWRQGAAMKYGKGRIVVFGEAAMFTAQFSGERRIPMGLNAPEGARNAPLLVNIIRWLHPIDGNTDKH
ncbi:DUF4350 domain-containing protein [bacterium]|nr:DUF4350 domain-containing protein [bacterium]